MKRMGTDAEPVFVVSGAFTGDSGLSLSNVNNADSVTMDLMDVTRMNSTGVREWHLWMTGLRSVNPDAIVILKNCPRFFIDTMNMIYEFVPGPHIVESFVVPMYCEKCDESQEVMLNHNPDENGSVAEIAVPQLVCESCGEAMEPDFVERTYFKFLTKSNDSLAKLRNS